MAHTRKTPELGDSLRGWERRTGISRDYTAAEIRAGRLRATQLSSRRFFVTTQDFFDWLKSRSIVPTDRASAVVERRLEREDRASAST